MMETSVMIGIIRFVEDESKFERFVNGSVQFGAPERYRCHPEGKHRLGVSDNNESRILTYREERDGADSAPLIEFSLSTDPRKIPDVFYPIGKAKSLDLKNADDHYISSWYTVSIDGSNVYEELERIKEETTNMISQFGRHSIFILTEDIPELISRMESHSNKKIISGRVKYTHDILKHGPLCKGVDFSYQQEYRFLIAGCGSKETAPLNFNCENGFHDLVKQGIYFKIEQGELYYALQQTG